MLRIDYPKLGHAVREKLVPLRRPAVEKMLGISHAAFDRLFHGRPVGTEIFITACEWLDEHPMTFVDWRSAAFDQSYHAAGDSNVE